MILMAWQLWIARNLCIDSPLPCQPPQGKLSPGRVAQAFAGILVAVGTPAKPPKTRGKSPGRSIGDFPPPHTYYPTVKKHPSKPGKSDLARSRIAAKACKLLFHELLSEFKRINIQSDH